MYYSGETSGSVNTAGDLSVVIRDLVCESQYSFTAQAIVEGGRDSENSTETMFTTGKCFQCSNVALIKRVGQCGQCVCGEVRPWCYSDLDPSSK